MMIGKSIVLVFFFVLTSGCSINTELKRKRKALKKIEQAKRLAPNLFTNDTITVIDTVYVPSYTHDTITQIIYHDTVTILNNDRVYAKYYYDTLEREIHHYIECKSDTIIKEVSTINNKPRKLTIKEWIELNWFKFAVIVFGLFLLLNAIIKKI